MIVTLDTNVLLSAAFFPGVCDQLLAHCLISPAIQIALSEYILAEFVEHGTGKLGGSRDQVEAFAGQLRQGCAMLEPASVPDGVVSDHDDLPVIGTAVAAGAEYLVTGDKVLLNLERYGQVEVLPPRAFFDRIRPGNA